MSRRVYERKLREDQEAAAHVFQDFIETFQNFQPAPCKTFVKSGVLYGDKKEDNSPEIYSPKPFIVSNNTTSIKTALECAKILKEGKVEKSKKKKPKSNLEQLKEELKMKHSERDEREKEGLKEEIAMGQPALSYFDGGDPNSTNLFLANLNCNITENELMKEFGEFGALASVKIMWPRGDDRHRSPTNCGFVAYMSRKDAERAIHIMRHRTDMRVGWGKSVELPLHPIYIPNDLLKLYLPPPQSGLPFNAQLPKVFDRDMELEELLFRSTVKVTIPLNKKVLALVNRVVEFVVRDGPMFEAILMNKEINNPEFNFLFDLKSPVHIYYRWKLYSVLHGDSVKSWNMNPFRMFVGGSVWLPPVAPNYTEGMPDHLIREKSNEVSKLSENQCDRLVSLIQELTLNRLKVAEVMIFCLGRILSINDSLQIIVESLTGTRTNPIKKISRLYLLSDILSNCKIKNVNYDTVTEDTLIEIFKSLYDCYKRLRMEADKRHFKTKVLRVVEQWDCYKIFSESCIRSLEQFFIENDETAPWEDRNSSSDDEPLDGNSLLKRSLKSVSSDCVHVQTKQIKESENRFKYFVPSKWDTLDPEEVNSQAVSTQEIYLMELENEARMKQEDEKRNRDSVCSEEKSPKKRKRSDKERNKEKVCKNRSKSKVKPEERSKDEAHRDSKRSSKRNRKCD